MIFLGVGIAISSLNEASRRGMTAVARAEERLRTTLVGIGDGVIATDDAGRVTRLNPVAEALTGWTEGDAVGRPLNEVFRILNEENAAAGGEPGATRARRRPHRRPREPHPARGPGRTGDADRRQRRADQGRGGAIVGAVLIFRDVSRPPAQRAERAELLKNERAARLDAASAEEQLRLALEAGRMGTWEWSIGKGTVRWSHGLETIHGLAPGTFPGTFEAVQREVHPDDRERVADAIRRAVASGAPYRAEYRIVRADGAVRWVEGVGQAFHDANGQPSHMVGVCSDVTERKQSEEA